MGGGDGGIAGDGVAKPGDGLIEFGFLEVGEADVDASHGEGRVGGEDLFEFGDALGGVEGVDEHEAEVVAGVEGGGVEIDGAAVGFEGGGGIAGFLQR